MNYDIHRSQTSNVPITTTYTITGQTLIYEFNSGMSWTGHPNGTLLNQGLTCNNINGQIQLIDTYSVPYTSESLMFLNTIDVDNCPLGLKAIIDIPYLSAQNAFTLELLNSNALDTYQGFGLNQGINTISLPTGWNSFQLLLTNQVQQLQLHQSN